MKTGFITTVDTNIGDDFIRVGIKHVLSRIMPSINYQEVNKHDPLSIYHKYYPLYWLKSLPTRLRHGRFENLVRRCLAGPRHTRLNDCDLIIQSGAPVIWPDCHQNEWAEPIWHDVVGKISQKGNCAIWNLGAGSCYPWENQPDTILNQDDRAYIKSITRYCTLTTSRDPLAKELFETVSDQSIQLLPCPAFFSSTTKSLLLDSDYVLINYMPGGGHFDWGQKIDNQKWEETIKTVIAKLKKKHSLAFLAHNKREADIANSLKLGLPIMQPKSVNEYNTLIKKSKAAINNRMHASVNMASSGVPSIAVGTDTRLLMVKELGLPIHYVKNADAELLIEQMEELIENRFKHQSRLIQLKNTSLKSYQVLLNNHLLK